MSFVEAAIATYELAKGSVAFNLLLLLNGALGVWVLAESKGRSNK